MSARGKRVSALAVETDLATSQRMGRIRQKNTKPEQAVRGHLYALGHRYRVENRDLPGSPDAANRSRRWAVFVHGCFWHSHARCPKATVPKRNRDFWLEKFRQNRERDARVVTELKDSGYLVITVWECETQDARVLRRRLRSLLRPRHARGHRAGS